MKHWETTVFGMMAAIGQILQNTTSFPPWVWTLGECLNAIGLVGLGLYAPSQRMGTKAEAAPRPEPPKNDPY